ncbi:MAG: GGDEF domain-containing protein [Pseudomonadota bacterium]
MKAFVIQSSSAFLIIATFFNINIASASLDTFLFEQYLVTYDCPDPNGLTQVQAYVSRIDDFSHEQQLHLGVLYAHHLICIGSAQTAEENLRAQLNTLNVNKTSEMYARANYVLGLALDFQEKDERCDWYLRARELSENTFVDISVSSRLGLITYCSRDLQVFELLEKSYEVLEEYSNTKNNGLLAHIHNSIGLLYGHKSMHFLAAEQYLKAHELGLDVYTGANRVSALVSAIVSLNASGQYDEVLKRLDEFKALSEDINTPSTNVFYLFQLANYYSATTDFEPMREVLAEWELLLPKLANRRFNVFHSMFSAMLCEYDGDEACVADFIELVENPDMPQMRVLNTNDRYKRFLVQAYLRIGDVEKARKAFDDYVALEQLSKTSAEKHDIALQVSQLRDKIQNLQLRIEDDRHAGMSVQLTIAVFLCLLITIGLLFKKHSKKQAEYDPTTQLLNSAAIMNRINKLDAPATTKNHALIIFDIRNFREVNVALGMTKGDYILKKVAETLRSVTRNNDLVGRMSPEQFIICLTDISDEHVDAFVKRTKSKLGSELFIRQGSKGIGLNSSFSVYVTSDKFNELDEILQEMLTRLNKDNDRDSGASV